MRVYKLTETVTGEYVDSYIKATDLDDAWRIAIEKHGPGAEECMAITEIFMNCDDLFFSLFSPMHRALVLIESLKHPTAMDEDQRREYHELLRYTDREPILMNPTDSEIFLFWPWPDGPARGKAWVYCEPLETDANENHSG